MRHALGVTLSILCSNIRLYNSSHHDERQNNIDILFKDASWVQNLTERATEAVVNIQNATQSDKAMSTVDTNLENGHSDGDSQDDVKSMETVLMAA